LSPADVGIPDCGRRHTPGLRREEVAVLAGVGVSWYTWLEQGRDIKVSDSVLDAISGALRLNQAERTHLYLLAGLNPPQQVAESTSVARPQLQRLLDGWLPNPACILDRYWNYKYLNAAMALVFGYTEHDNRLIVCFTNERYRAARDSWGDRARTVVAQFRAAAAHYPDDPGFEQLASRLTMVSPEFAEMWSRHEVRDEFEGYKTINDPEVGDLAFEYMLLPLPDRSGLRISLLNPRAGTATGAKLVKLLADHGITGPAEAGWTSVEHMRP
jgi:transcriptional regulator with XRE-family HTH domain